MTIEHTTQYDKITCKAFGMNCQAVPVSGAEHALVDLAGVARVKSHGEIAIKGLTNYVYDDDDGVQFPSREHSVSEQVCAPKETEAKEDTATPKTIGSLKQDHWILDKKNKQLIRAHITPRKALFTPTGTKECPVNPDNVSRERTTEIIDASEGGDPEILEDNWRLTSQANKPLINLWTGKTIFTFGDLLKDKESGPGSAADRIIDKKGQSTIEPDPAVPSKEEPTSLPLALGRTHQRLSKPEELKKLHLQHHHVTTDQFRFRTRALHLPKSIYDLFDKIRSECEVCQAAKHAPSRSKTSGLRADTFGDMTLIDHCQVPLGTGEHIIIFVILDGAMTLLTAEAVTTTQEAENITALRNYFDQHHLQPKSVADRRLGLHDGDMGTFLPVPRHYANIAGTKHTMAEAAVRLLKAQLKIMLNSIKLGNAPATLKKVTYRQLVKAAATVRNQTVTYGGVTSLELAFGRRPADLIQLDVATPTQLTIDRNEEELTAIQIKQLSKQAFQEARQSEDIRRDLAQNCRMSSKPLQARTKYFAGRKTNPIGSKGGIWLKGKIISLEGAMVGLDLGSRLIKVNMTKVRKNETIPPGKPGIDFVTMHPDSFPRGSEHRAANTACWLCQPPAGPNRRIEGMYIPHGPCESVLTIVQSREPALNQKPVLWWFLERPRTATYSSKGKTQPRFPGVAGGQLASGPGLRRSCRPRA